MEREHREAILDEADREAQLKRAGVECMLDIIEENEAAFREVFVDDTVQQSGIQAVAALIQKTEEMLEWTTQEATRVVGVVMYTDDAHEPALRTHPYVQLGWAKCQEHGGPSFIKNDRVVRSYGLLPTQHAKDMTNRYLAAQGKPLLEEMYQRREALRLSSRDIAS